MTCFRIVALPAVLFVAMLGSTRAAEPTPEGIAFFEKKIRPVLAKHCYKCHSVTAKKIGGELLLDTRAAAHKGGESGPAIVPGDLKKSLLIVAIRHEDMEMPPKSKLPKQVIADFEKWVKMGAPDPRDGEAPLLAKEKIDIEAGRKFWSFRRLEDQKPPAVKNNAWAKTDVDRFILAKQEAKSIPAGEFASRRTLVRRAYFDVWGLPPTPQEVEAFLADKSTDAFAKVVDRLLAGEHYGERWARHWLDLARFAESNGYAFDKDRNAAYHFRDFVIKALNEDMPYDKFIRLQIAGDLIAPKDYMAQAATGFLASGPFTSQQTQKERERSRYEQLDDIVSTLGTATLGLTLGCARCHAHKYDPVPSHDYYRLLASFAETGFQDISLKAYAKGTEKAKKQYEAAHKVLIDARLKFEREQLPARLVKWLAKRPAKTVGPKLGNWHVVGPFAAANFNKAFAQVFAPEKKVDLKQTFAGGKVKWTPRPEWKDGAVHNTLTGNNSANYLHRTIEMAAAGPLDISLGRDDAIKVFLNGKPVYGKKQPGGAAPDQDKVKLVLKAGRNDLLLKIVNASGPSGFYFKALDNRPPKKIQDILALADAKRNAAQKKELLKWFAPHDADWQKLNAAELAHTKKQPKQKAIKIFAARKGGATYNFGANTRKVYFLARGNSNSKLGLATPGFLQVMMIGEQKEKQWTVKTQSDGKPQSKPSRVATADWLTDDKLGAGHLLARVIVNRLWQHHLGRGIVGTPSDFGTQGERPTHPELLDYLANKLVLGGWKLKPIHKLIMTSSVYMQSGKTHVAGMKKDPANKLWWRRPSQRVEAEVIRDTLLAVGGSLDKKMFGAGSLNQEDRRRSVYLKVKRDTLIPVLQLFDAPDAMQSIGERTVTTVPPQALAMMNSSFVRKLAEQFAKRVRPKAEMELSRVVDDAYAVALSRPPSDDERKQMLVFIETQTKSYGGDAKATDRAVADFCQLVMCLNEFMFVD